MRLLVHVFFCSCYSFFFFFSPLLFLSRPSLASFIHLFHRSKNQGTMVARQCTAYHWNGGVHSWCTTITSMVRQMTCCTPLRTFHTVSNSFGNKSANALEASISKMRNIGIVAHIDAGKTTTTERMLFYAGSVKRVGEVDSGTTTTDFLKEEMDRGITIQSAAVSLQWRDHSIHLIDTPGHVDFTVEVERAMRVVDGVVALFDASAGVQAQSYTVLHQSKKFGVPVIGFLNKMDKYNSNFKKSVDSIRTKLEVEPLLLQLPLMSEDGTFEGVMDVIEMTTCRFSGNHGMKVEVKDLRVPGSEPEHLVHAAIDARHALFLTLTALDDPLSDALIAALDQTDGNEMKAEELIPSDVMRAAIRHQMLRQDATNRAVMPVLCGASRRDQGVQPLLDAITYYLPSPKDRTLTGYTCDGGVVPLPPSSSALHIPFVALAFKVTHAMNPKGRRQPLVFFRVYSGKLMPNTPVINRNNNRHESIDKLYVMQANNRVEVPCLVAGEIGAAFMQHTKTGATLFQAPQHTRLYAKDGAGDVFTLEGIDAPPPVISFSIEAATKQQIPLLEAALQELCFEDPSLCTRKNDFGQLVVSGMGELHLEIVMSRLEHEHGLKCRLLRAIIEYREVITVTVELLNGVGTYNELPYVECSFRLKPLLDSDNTCAPNQGCSFAIDKSFADSFLTATSNSQGDHDHRRRRMEDHHQNAKEELRLIMEVFSNAVTDCSHLGPLAGLPLHGVQVLLTSFKKIGPTQLTERPLAHAARSLMLQLFRSVSKTDLAALEPMMEVEVHLSESTYIGEVVNSLNQRKAITVDIQDDGKSVKAILPMRNIVRYTMELRMAVKGHANLYTRLHHYRVIEDKNVLSRIMRNLGIYED